MGKRCGLRLDEIIEEEKQGISARLALEGRSDIHPVKAALRDLSKDRARLTRFETRICMDKNFTQEVYDKVSAKCDHLENCVKKLDNDQRHLIENIYLKPGRLSMSEYAEMKRTTKDVIAKRANSAIKELDKLLNEKEIDHMTLEPVEVIKKWLKSHNYDVEHLKEIEDNMGYNRDYIPPAHYKDLKDRTSFISWYLDSSEYLTKKQSHMLWYTYIRGFTFDYSARTDGVTKSVVQKRVTQGIAKLAKLYEKQFRQNIPN